LGGKAKQLHAGILSHPQGKLLLLLLLLVKNECMIL